MPNCRVWWNPHPLRTERARIAHPAFWKLAVAEIMLECRQQGSQVMPEFQAAFLYEVIRIDQRRCRVRLTLLEKTTGKTGNFFAPWTMHKIGDTFASAYPPPTHWRVR